MGDHYSQETNVRSRKLLRVTDVVLFVCAAVLVGRAIPQRNPLGIDLVLYARGGARMPFQARYMMAPILRAVHESAGWTRAAQTLKNSAYTPEQLAVQVADVLGILLAAFCASRLFTLLAPQGALRWMVKWVLLWVVVVTYVARYEQTFCLPYDLPSLGFFSLGLLFAAYGYAVPFVLTVVIAAFNRETAVFLVPIWAMLQIYRKPRPWSALAAALLALVGCVFAKNLINRWLGVSGSGLQFMLGSNLRMLLPHHLPQVLSAGGFLVVPILLQWRRITSLTLKRIWIGYSPFVAGALAVGIWNETRIFGEISVIIACTATLLFEASISRAGSNLSRTPDGSSDHALRV